MHDKLHHGLLFIMMEEDGTQIMIVHVIHLQKHENAQVNIEMQHVMVIHNHMFRKKARM